MAAIATLSIARQDKARALWLRVVAVFGLLVSLSGILAGSTPLTDWIPLPSSIIFIYSVFDSSTDNEIYRDTNLRHAARFRDGDLPPVGAVTRWIRAEDRLYYRDRPAESVKLLLDYKYLPDNLTAEDATRNPETPPQYDEALLRFAISDYYTTTSGDDLEETMAMRQLASMAETSALQMMGMMPDPKAQDTKGRHDTMIQRGYVFGVGR